MGHKSSFPKSQLLVRRLGKLKQRRRRVGISFPAIASLTSTFAQGDRRGKFPNTVQIYGQLQVLTDKPRLEALVITMKNSSQVLFLKATVPKISPSCKSYTRFRPRQSQSTLRRWKTANKSYAPLHPLLSIQRLPPSLMAESPSERHLALATAQVKQPNAKKVSSPR